MRFFGEFEVIRGGVEVPIRGAKQRSLLALARGTPVSADRVIDQLWGEEQIANTANTLQTQIGQLRRTLGAAAIVTSEAGYALDVGPDDLDAARFEQLAAKARHLLQEGEAALASSTLGEASSCGGESRSVSSRTRASLMPSRRTWTTWPRWRPRPASWPRTPRSTQSAQRLFRQWRRRWQRATYGSG